MTIESGIAGAIAIIMIIIAKKLDNDLTKLQQFQTLSSGVELLYTQEVEGSIPPMSVQCDSSYLEFNNQVNTMVSTSGISRGKVLAALYNNSKVQGMGQLQARQGHVMDENEVEALLSESNYFDYLYGKIMKVDLSDPEGFNPGLYDRDNGFGAAQAAISSIS